MQRGCGIGGFRQELDSSLARYYLLETLGVRGVFGMGNQKVVLESFTLNQLEDPRPVRQARLPILTHPQFFTHLNNLLVNVSRTSHATWHP